MSMLKSLLFLLLLTLANFLGDTLYSQESDHEKNVYTWYDGEQERKVYLLNQYMAIANDSSKETAKAIQVMVDGNAKKIRHSGRYTIYQIPSHQADVIEKKRKVLVRKARPVFSEEKNGAPEMILGDDIFVYFKKNLTSDEIQTWAKKSGVIIKRQFLPSKNGWIINVKTDHNGSSAPISLDLTVLETAKKIRADTQHVVKTVPKWYRSNIELK